MTISVKIERFPYFNFETDFLESENLFQKTGVHFFSWKHKIENASFLKKTVILEVNVKTNRMVNTKWTYHKERSFASNHFIFLKILLQFEDLYKNFVWCTHDWNAHIPTFCKRWSFIWRYFFIQSIFKLCFNDSEGSFFLLNHFV